MWTSVPQIDATFTRIRTSVGPGDGIATVRISVLFGAGFDFTAAFIVDAIPKSPGRVRSWTLGISTFYHSLVSVPESGMHALSLRSALDGMQLRRAVADEDKKVLASSELLVEVRIPRVDPEDGCRGEFARCSDDDHIPGANSPKHGGTH